MCQYPNRRAQQDATLPRRHDDPKDATELRPRFKVIPRAEISTMIGQLGGAPQFGGETGERQAILQEILDEILDRQDKLEREVRSLKLKRKSD